MSILCEFSSVGRRVCSAVGSVRPYVQNRHIFDAVKEEIQYGLLLILLAFSLYMYCWPLPILLTFCRLSSCTVGFLPVLLAFFLYCWPSLYTTVNWPSPYTAG